MNTQAVDPSLTAAMDLLRNNCELKEFLDTYTNALAAQHSLVTNFWFFPDGSPFVISNKSYAKLISDIREQSESPSLIFFDASLRPVNDTDGTRINAFHKIMTDLGWSFIATE
jgi:hypothetical protein